ncbi:UNVERIFIED_CONTAM: putative pentatricopeptide repeat-containing protein [Sesamum latifolium]|uniref:Pentatricopeptide repeat-containing protein n=1 Tax=Sesamum latifolium TaxID=2727402 RepID=A0AAW2XQL8_9LAMI
MHSNGVYLDSYALCTSLKSASCLKNVCLGKMMHAYVEKSGWLASVFVGSALVDFYAKSLYMNDAVKMFGEIPVKNTVCANALMSGYAEAKMWDQGIQLVRRMPILGLAVDNFTMSAALRACSGLCALEFGKQVHANIIRCIIDVGADVFLQSLLIEMYGKCGLVDSAKRVFNMMGYEVGERQCDVVLWTSMLGVYGRNGNYIEVIRLFKSMLMEGIRPDGVAFLTVISACGHTGQVDLGMEYFESMTREYGLVASQEHYSCLVDLLCRAGELQRACKLVSEMSFTGDKSCAISMWGALLSACNECGNVNLGKLAAQRALELEPDNVGVYVLLSNMYARNGMWAEIEQLRESIKQKGLKKEIGWSCIDATSSVGGEFSYR